MSSMFGNYFKISLFGESHSESIGIVIDGLKAGLKLDLDFINKQLSLRRPSGDISTKRVEDDEYKFISGYFNNHTTGTPLCVLVKNNNFNSKDYSKTKDLIRPSHADYTAYLKYQGYQDYRGGGHFSGRLTTPLVIAGAIALQLLNKKGVIIGTHIKSLHNIFDEEFNQNELEKQINKLNNKYFATLSEKKEQEMINRILEAKNNQDSVGGILETCVVGVEGGIGEPFFDSIESVISHLLFSIPGVKGVEFGLGFDLTKLFGSKANDQFIFDNGIKTITNNNGGINGGITNKMPLVIKTAIKPTSSIGKKQSTVDISTNEEKELIIEGRHDPAIIHRARVVVDSMIAIGLVEMYLTKYGYEWMET